MVQNYLHLHREMRNVFVQRNEKGTILNLKLTYFDLPNFRIFHRLGAAGADLGRRRLSGTIKLFLFCWGVGLPLRVPPGMSVKIIGGVGGRLG